MRWSDPWRFAIGTLTAIPIAPPRTVTRRVAAWGLLLAPPATVPLGALVALVLWAGAELSLPPLAVAASAVGALALANRGFHLDGLADTADGLAASYDREKALAVMKTGDVGPAGAVAIAVVLIVQIGGLVALIDHPLAAGVLVAASRRALVVACLRGVPAARPVGLGASVAGSVPVWMAIAGTAVTAAFVSGVFAIDGLDWWHGAVSLATGLAAAAMVTWHCVRRLGGVSGDVLGAAVELSLAAILLTATA
jgi:adenosylcobinamide-GDP ribazoletransferase